MLFFVFSVNSQTTESGKLTTSVKYVSAENVYLNTGITSGIHIGDKFTVFRNTQIIGHIEVIYVAQNSASCKIIDGKQSFSKNDKAVRTYAAPVKEEIPDTLKEQRQRKVSQFKRSRTFSKPFARLSGSVSLQWYQFLDSRKTNESDLSFSQPTARVNLKARQLWGKDFNFYIKMRSRYDNRASRFSSSNNDRNWTNRLYTLGFEYSDIESPVNFQLGRITSRKFSGIGYIDGAVIQLNASQKFNFGVFAGTQPQWQYSDFQTSMMKYGLYFNYSSGEYQTMRFESTLAAAGEYHNNTISREFVYIQNSFSNSNAWHFYQSMSLDINRYWRKEKSKESVSLSNLYLSGRYKFSKSISAGLSYDNRKNYLTYETKSIAEELFDDAQRQGLRTNMSILLPRKVRITANFGIRKRQNESDITYSFNSSISKSDLFIRSFRGSLNISGFSNLYTNGYNPSVRLSHYFNSGHSIGLSGGSYFYSLNNSDIKRTNNWAGFESYIYFFNKVFLMTNYEYNWGDDAEGHRVLAELGYRF